MIRFNHVCSRIISTTMLRSSSGHCINKNKSNNSRHLLQRRLTLLSQPPVLLFHQPSCCHCRNFHDDSSSSSSSSSLSTLKDILEQVSRGELDPETALTRMQYANITTTTATTVAENNFNKNDDILQSFANLDYQRSERTGFPEAIFAQGKTSQQVATLLDNMAHNFTQKYRQQQQQELELDHHHHYYNVPTAILATRVTPEMFHNLSKMTLQYGELEYHETARIVSMKPHGIIINDAAVKKHKSQQRRPRVVVATAGTTDIFVAEEAAIVLEATGVVQVDRIYDCGVAGLHRIIHALPRLRHEHVGAIIVCAGMDGALPSVIGGLVTVPVIAVPTSIGYGVSFAGVSALLTMLNSCAPGVGVVNIDNGFGAAVLAFKCLVRGQKQR